MASKEEMFTVTKDALVVRIPWKELAALLGIKSNKSSITAEDVLHMVAEGRKAYRHGKTKVIHSLSELKS